MKQFQAYLASRTERERQILILGLVFGLPLLLWLGLWQPLLNAKAGGATTLEQRRDAYVWMQQAAATIVANQGSASRSSLSGSPQQRITTAASKQGISLSRIEPLSGGRYTVWVSSTDYTSAVYFVDSLISSGLSLESLSMNLLDVPGTVSLRASFGGGQ